MAVRFALFASAAMLLAALVLEHPFGQKAAAIVLLYVVAGLQLFAFGLMLFPRRKGR